MLLPSRILGTRLSLRGFTLVELLVVIMIMLLLTAITVATVNITIDGDKVRAGARQVQSYLEGARSRAVTLKRPVGVRFLLDPTNPRTVSSMIYITTKDFWSEGTLWLERLDVIPPPSGAPPSNYGDGIPDGDTDEIRVLRGFDGSLPPLLNDFGFTPAYKPQDTNWLTLYRDGLLRTGNRIEIPAGSNRWYVVDTRLLDYADLSDGDPPVRLILQTPLREKATRAWNATNSPPPTGVQAEDRPFRGGYRLELTPAPLEGQEPVQLPKGVVIHLDRCSSDPDDPSRRGDRLPSTWRVNSTAHPTGFEYSKYCDVIFSPRGTVVGAEAALGIIHLYIGEQKDADRDHDDWADNITGPTAPEFSPGQTASDPAGPAYQRGDKVVLSIYTRTGAVTVNPIHPKADTDKNMRFYYAETGEVAGR